MVFKNSAGGSKKNWKELSDYWKQLTIKEDLQKRVSDIRSHHHIEWLKRECASVFIYDIWLFMRFKSFQLQLKSLVRQRNDNLIETWNLSGAKTGKLNYLNKNIIPNFSNKFNINEAFSAFLYKRSLSPEINTREMTSGLVYLQIRIIHTLNWIQYRVHGWLVYGLSLEVSLSKNQGQMVKK